MGIDDESSHPELCSEVAGGVTRTIVCLSREPDAGNLPDRFDEREQETELRQTGLRRVKRKRPNSHREAKATAPVLDSTPHCAHPPTSFKRFRWERNRKKSKFERRCLVTEIVAKPVLCLFGVSVLHDNKI